MCRTDRSKTSGFCGANDKIKAAKAGLHLWEEPALSGRNGSGAVFFSGCSLKCCFCQNSQISHANFGKEITVQRLGDIFLELQEQGADNINLVSPTHFVPYIIKALDQVRHKLIIPIVYNSSGYERVETLKLLKGYIDIYLPDLKYFSSDDIYVYSIDEVFIDVTHYLKTYNMGAKELVTKVIQDVYQTTGITATAGIGTNLYLCKIAMDTVAKHVKPDKNGVRIADLDEMTYRKLLWSHRPLTDFWRVGKGYSKRLEEHGMYTMGDVAKMSVKNEELLYKLFGVNAELLIDHAWGWENVTIESIKAYRPATNSICSGQVLHCPYNYENTKLILKEMTELLALDLVEKGLVTNQIVLEIGYDVDNLKNQAISSKYNGEITTDKYGRKVPKHAHGTINIDHQTSSSKVLTEHIIKLYEQIINKQLLVRRINITVNNVVNENMVQNSNYEQINLLVDYKEVNKKREKEEAEKEIQKAMINIKNKYGKNAIIKGMNLQKEGTTIERNKQIGGHKE